ncbi:uncharacterized protein JCM15063_000770 [Sporobolomyces koalae]|uniref:uncharacterized protein n=1 Tax=Sporobolomyces koalae TaxID=500713 RepID=UPI0031719992
MGVKDLLPTLRKLVPRALEPLESLSRLPPRTKFALDANLLTTRFHLAASTTTDPTNLSESAAIKSWYTFLRDLERRGIEAVVVFDGRGRKREKLKEVERRRQERRLQRARGQAESNRLERLRTLKDVWNRSSTPPPLADLTDGTTREREIDDLLEEYQLDRSNPIYSRNQGLLTTEEGKLLDAILRLRSTDSPLQPNDEPIADRGSTRSEDVALEQLEPFSAPEFAPSGGSLEQEIEQDAPRELAEDETSLPAAGDHDMSKTLLDPILASEPLSETLESLESEDSSDLVELDLDSLIRKSAHLSKSHMSRSAAVPSTVFKQVKKLIVAMGYPILTPSFENPYEAESICAWLYHDRATTGVTHVVSEDTDVLVYSAPLLTRVTTLEPNQDLAKPATRESMRMSITRPELVRTALGLTERQFVDWCLLCGTDFTTRIRGLGPKIALKLVRQSGSIEEIFANDKMRAKHFPIPHSPTSPALQAISRSRKDDDDRGGRDEEETTYEEYLETVRDARRIFLERPELQHVIEQGKTSNFSPVAPGPDDEPGSAGQVRKEWFDKKPEKTLELERLRHEFGLTRLRNVPYDDEDVWDLSIKVELELEDEDEVERGPQDLDELEQQILDELEQETLVELES